MLKSREVVKVQAGRIAVPEFMADDRLAGLEVLKQYVTPRRLKIVQRNSDEELLTTFFQGDIIVHPDNELVCSMKRDKQGRPTGESDGFLFTPLYMFLEFCTWNPFKLKGKEPAIINRSTDPHGRIAMKARNPETRFEQHPKDPSLQIRHVEHLNFVVAIEGVNDDEPVLLTFDRGDHRAGRQFCDLVVNRKGSLYGGVYAADLVLRENDHGMWWGVDVSNPSIEDSPPFVDEVTYKKYKALHQYYLELHQGSTLRPEYVQETEPDTTDIPF